MRPLTCIAVVVVLIGGTATALPGDLDDTFSGDGIATAFPAGSVATAVAVDPKGRIVVAGYTIEGGVDVVAARFRPGGGLDASFANAGRIRLDLGGQDFAFDLAVDDGGGIAIAGRRTTSSGERGFVVRLGPRGGLTRSFGGDGVAAISFGKTFQAANAVAFTPNDRIVVGGYSSNGTQSRSAFARLRVDGTYDRTFSGDGRATFEISPGAEQINDLLVTDDGRVIGAGYAEAGVQPRVSVVRVLPSGTLDRDFGRGDGAAEIDVGPGADVANAIARQPDGKLVLAGRSDDGWAVVRLGFAGRPDPTFAGDGTKVFAFSAAADEAHDLVPRGVRLVVVGRIRDDMGVLRLKTGGDPDRTFGDGDGRVLVDPFGGQDVARAVALQPSGRIVVGGEARKHGTPRIAVVRLRGS
jgi:uncharacterized delta-60 repeat protein